MKVGVLGSGVVGQTLAAGFLKYGHQVFVGTRDAKASDVTAWAEKNPKIEVGTFAQAAEFGELLVLAVLSRIVEDVIKLAGPHNFRGKTLIDTNNPIADAPPVDGVLQYFTQQNHSLGERIQQLLPDAQVVKAFNSVGAVRMVNPHYDQGTPTMFLCGNDATAKAQVSDIIRQFGWEPFDCGTIVASRALEPLCILWCIPGLRSNSWTHAFKLLTK
jgi:8-hydroxy-5-deazaflavin:NADPH oxidoreductase